MVVFRGNTVLESVSWRRQKAVSGFGRVIGFSGREAARGGSSLSEICAHEDLFEPYYAVVRFAE